MTVLLMICLFFHHRNLKKTKVCVQSGHGDENDKTDEILHKKQNRMIVQPMSCFFLYHKILKKTKNGIWGMMMRMMKSMKLCF